MLELKSIENEKKISGKFFSYNGITFKHIKRRSYEEVFHCYKCRKDFAEKDFWRSENLIYLCNECKQALK